MLHAQYLTSYTVKAMVGIIVKFCVEVHDNRCMVFCQLFDIESYRNILNDVWES